MMAAILGGFWLASAMLLARSGCDVLVREVTPELAAGFGVAVPHRS